MASKKKNTTDFSSDRPPKSIGDGKLAMKGELHDSTRMVRN